jgi:hypothetical protein
MMLAMDDDDDDDERTSTRTRIVTTALVKHRANNNVINQHFRDHDDDDNDKNAKTNYDASTTTTATTSIRPPISSTNRHPKHHLQHHQQQSTRSQQQRTRIPKRSTIIIASVIFLLIEFFLMTLWSQQLTTTTTPVLLSSSLLSSSSSSSHYSTYNTNSNSNNDHSTDDRQTQQQQGRLPKSVRRKRRRRRNRRPQHRVPDGHFNGHPIYYHDLTINASYYSRPYSAVRCVGENYQGPDKAWTHRSCHFRFLCYNTSSHEFEVYQRPDDIDIHHHLLMASSAASAAKQQQWRTTTTTTTTTTDYMDMTSSVLLDGNVSSVSIGGLGTNYDDPRYWNFQWFPTIVSSQPPDKYYALEEGLVLVPFHSTVEDDDTATATTNNTGRKNGHSVVWDDFLPIYTLLSIFQLVTPIRGSRLGTNRHDHNHPINMDGIDDNEEKEEEDNDDPGYNYYDENQAFIMRYTLSPQPEQQQSKSSSSLLNKFIPLMVHDHTRRHPQGNDHPPSHQGPRHQHRNWKNQQERSIESTIISTQYDAILRLSSSPSESSTAGTKGQQSEEQQQQYLQSNLICARDGVAGVGPLTSHKLTPSRYRYMNKRRRTMYDQHSHNHGKGIVLWWFRQYCLSNLGLLSDGGGGVVENDPNQPGDDDDSNNNNKTTMTNVQRQQSTRQKSLQGAPGQIRIVFSPPTSATRSNDNNNNNDKRTKHFLDFHDYEQCLRDEYSNDRRVQIESYDRIGWDNLSLVQQVQLVLQSTIFVTSCDGTNGSNDVVSMSTFLPKGATLIVVYDNSEMGGTTLPSAPNCRDWDLINNMSYLRVHWLPTTTPTSSNVMTTGKDEQKMELLVLKSFSTLIRHEIYFHTKEGQNHSGQSNYTSIL